jgi:hypothetical protein
VLQVRQQARQLPGLLRERLPQQPPLLVQVAVIVVELLGSSEQEQRSGLAGLADRVHGRRLAGGVVGHHPAVQPPVVRQAEDPEVAAQVVPEACLLAEDQPPHPRVQPVGADHQAKAAWRAELEADLDAVAVLVQRAIESPNRYSTSSRVASSGSRSARRA